MADYGNGRAPEKMGRRWGGGESFKECCSAGNLCHLQLKCDDSVTVANNLDPMNVDFSRAHDCFFGPPSELIDVAKFIEEAATIPSLTAEDVLEHPGWQVLSDDERAAVEEECLGGYVRLRSVCDGYLTPNSQR